MNPMTKHHLTFLSASMLAFVLATPVVAESPDGWYRDGRDLIAERRAQRGEIQPARNVILFIGDGMSLATVSAARILEGQLRGQTGEENLLYFERFEHLALSKTYNTNQQTPDSAGTMTAMATGVKTFAGSIAVDQLARRGDCESVAGSELVTILDLAAMAGLGTGVVTTTRITHATPAALFARVPDRAWETDTGVPPTAREAGCTDIARQLVEYQFGGGIDVVLGGGRRAFLPLDVADPEYPETQGQRSDKENLIEAWLERHPDGHYVWNSEQFEALPGVPEGPVLGLFQPSHMHYEHDRPDDMAGEPSIAEMTTRAIEMLSGRENGYFLMVEGGRIDHAHHVNNAWRALTDTIAFAEAIEAAHAMAGDDTLIIVTADHGHAMAFGNYGERGNPIAGLAVRPGDGPAEERLMLDEDGRPVTVLTYSSGPGYRAEGRPDFDQVDPFDPDYRQEALYSYWSASHSGEDVPVYATGPGAEVLFGVIEQNVIYHAMLQAHPLLKAAAERIGNEQGRPDWQRLLEVSAPEE
jgi:alkaline phosphatase